MEEILASIRRIISEDDAPPDEGTQAAPAPAPAVAAEAVAEPEAAPAAEEPALESAPAPTPEPESEAVALEPEEEELELTEKVETLGDLDVFSREAPAAQDAAPSQASAPAEPLVSAAAATAAASAFGALSAAIAMPRSDRTLEDVVRELLRPMLQAWLDQNLPGIVQQAVEAEVDRIARGRVR